MRYTPVKKILGKWHYTYPCWRRIKPTLRAYKAAGYTLNIKRYKTWFIGEVFGED